MRAIKGGGSRNTSPGEIFLYAQYANLLFYAPDQKSSGEGPGGKYETENILCVDIIKGHGNISLF